MLRGGRVPIAFNCASSRRLVDQKGDFALFEAEVDEAIALVYCVAPEALAQENVPVWLPALVHVFLDNCRNFHARFHMIRWNKQSTNGQIKC